MSGASAPEGAGLGAADLAGLVGPVVVACSGGGDSLGLLVLAAEARLAPVAVHVDHGLRAGSAAEAEVVRAAAGRLGAGFRGARVEVAGGGNLEARARHARYAALEAARAELGATVVLVAHTADDQAETVLLNLLRGSATAGLAGIPRRRDAIVRPLLGVRRQALADLCAARGLEPVDDPSNRDRAHRRSWIRHDVLPVLSAGAERDLVPVLARQAALLRDDDDLLEALARDLLARAGPTEPATQVLVAAPVALARRAIRRWLGPPPPSAADVERVLAIVRHDRRAVELPGARRVTRSGGRLRVEGAPGVLGGLPAAAPRASRAVPSRP